MTVPARGSTETTLIPLLGRWDISVQGPNRFWYDAKGSITGAAREVDVEVAPRTDRAARLTLRSGAKAVRLVLRPLAHAGTSRTVDLPAHGSTELTWPTDHGWFDVDVTCAQDAAFRRRVTGHVDTGRESLTP